MIVDWDKLLDQVQVLVRANELHEARCLVTEAIRQAPDNATGWLIYSLVPAAPSYRAAVLRKAHAMDPENSGRRLLELERKFQNSVNQGIMPLSVLPHLVEPRLKGSTQALSTLGLSTRPYRALVRHGVRTVGQLAALTEHELTEVRNLGEKALDEIRARLDDTCAQMPTGIAQLESSVSAPPKLENDLAMATPIQALGLSRRTFNVLYRAGIHTVETLIQWNDVDLQSIRQSGPKLLAEVQHKLDVYKQKYPAVVRETSPVEAADSVPADHAPHQDLAVGLPCDDIPVDRLGMPLDLTLSLLHYGADSVAKLLEQGPAARYGDSYWPALNHYLEWLRTQDEATIAQEVANQGVNPMHLQMLRETSLAELISGVLSALSERAREVITWRYGLKSQAHSLQEIGFKLNVSRERVRQIEKKALGVLRLRAEKLKRHPLILLMIEVAERNGGIVSLRQLVDGVGMHLDTSRIIAESALCLILDLHVGFVELSQLKAWSLPQAPVSLATQVSRLIVTILAAEQAPLSEQGLLEHFKNTPFYDEQGQYLTDTFILGCASINDRIGMREDGTYGLQKWERGITDEMILALRAIGRPAHYSEIAEAINRSGAVEQAVTPRAVHVRLGQKPELFVWVGQKGTYGLKEWGLNRSLSYVDAIASVLQAAGEPLTLDQVSQRLPQVRQYLNPNSVLLTLSTHERFRVFPNSHYGLAEWATGMNQMDFGDKFGSQLTRWQEEVDHRTLELELQPNHMPSSVPNIGLDFFS